MAPCWIQYSERRSMGKNILGGERLQNLVSKCCLKQIPMVTGILVSVYLHDLSVTEHDTIGETNENKWHSTQESRTPQKTVLLIVMRCSFANTERHSLYMYIRPITRARIKKLECIRTYKCILTQSFWTGTKVIRRKHIVQPTGFGAYSSTCY